MKDEYVIISKTDILKRIEELEKMSRKELWNYMEKETLQDILSQSTPLIPEIEKAVLEGVNSIRFENDGSHWREDDAVETYIANLKLDI